MRCREGVFAAGGRSLSWFLLLGLGYSSRLWAVGEPSPVIFSSGPGRFEVAAVDAAAAQNVTRMAEEAWQLLAGPLLLPNSFSSAVFVRLLPAGTGDEAGPFRVVVEAGGIVSLRIAWSAGMKPGLLRRALVQGLLMRLAVAAHGVNARLAVPLWLEHAGVGWWETRAEPAQLDWLKQEARRAPLPGLEELLTWSRGTAEPRSHVAGAVWLLTFLQSESGRSNTWADFLRRILAGEVPAAAMAATYGSHFIRPKERELWWQTGGRQWRRGRTLPVLDAAESAHEIAGLARFVFARGDTDVAVALVDVMAHAREPVVHAELARRGAELGRINSSLHPFYRNAGLSLADVLGTGTEDPSRRSVRCAAFERDWRDARELEAAATAALDALEKAGPISGQRPPSDR